jgi:transcriptional regulator with XRE-family HTH domain
MTHEPVGRQNGAAMRAFRKKDGISVVDMARYLDIHPQSLRNIENGRRSAGEKTIRDAARILVVPIEAITRSGTNLGITEEDPAESELAKAS